MSAQDTEIDAAVEIIAKLRKDEDSHDFTLHMARSRKRHHNTRFSARRKSRVGGLPLMRLSIAPSDLSVEE